MPYSNITSNDSTDIKNIKANQRLFFDSGKTKSVPFRIQHLKKLKKTIEKYEADIENALYLDLKKSAAESYVTEIGIVLKELDLAIQQTANWSKSIKVNTPLFFSPATSKRQAEPYGCTLIISPWNYPFQLLLSPIIGAISAGNTVICKPSEYAPHTSAISEKIITTVFDSSYVTLIKGGIAQSTLLLKERWDYIFFTGSTDVGKIVYQSAAQHLTPVTLELGGKSPCVIDKDIHLENTAKRIIWGKFMNVGQTCIAPDYLLIHEDIKGKILPKLIEKIEAFYTQNPETSEDYGRIINLKHFNRLHKLLDKNKIIFGGQTNAEDLYIAPTILDKVSLQDPIMQEEIFGPILPIITWREINEVTTIINNKEKPLALYVFSKNHEFSSQIINKCSSGGACINDTLIHIGNPNLPFGGVGDSGIGAYHGHASFDTFSHYKSILHKSPFIDLDIRYAPWKKNYEKLKFLIKKLL